ncbi:MAG TPA: type II toxin-antitoxin system VapC family toxin [Candidatus Baltobacteraceae bacterium]|nr:type II toxin-antitoxin system VapC family toxin [Candidatus Baltobacteraceae bacterium]
MRTVVDASAVFSWIFDDERDELAVAMARFVVANGAHVPLLFTSEAQNILAVAVRRKRATTAEAGAILAALARLPLRVETSGTELGSQRAFEAALRWGISAYDAAYLVLAQDLDATLMTRDRRLNAAAENSGIRWVCAD